ncbi:hypothetical protein CR513_45361, partial [Mucuna pruriens]
MEGRNQFGLGFMGLCLVLDVDLPADFKTPKFDKYNRSSCLRAHLIDAYVYDDEILAHYFQDSLTRVALKWYVSLERGHVKTWRDLAETFLKQYKYNEDMAPDCSRLQNMVKREHEGFKEYARRWHELALPVQPPITEKEMAIVSIDTLSSPYYDKEVGSVAFSFVDLVVADERIELGIRRGKLTRANGSSRQRKKQGKVNISRVDDFLIAIDAIRAYVGVVVTLGPTQQGVSRPPRTLTLIPITYTELLPQLLEQKLVEIVPLKPLVRPYLRSYTPCHRKVLESKTQGPRSSGWWFSRFLRSTVERVKQPSPSPQRCDYQHDRQRKQGEGIALQENPKRFGLSYTGPIKRKRLGQKTQGMQWMQWNLRWGHHTLRSNCSNG